MKLVSIAPGAALGVVVDDRVISGSELGPLAPQTMNDTVGRLALRNRPTRRRRGSRVARNRQFTRAKSLDTFRPMGPLLVTADEIPDPQTLSIRCLVNGTVMQDSNTSDMVFSVAELVSFCSQAFTLEPGDVIATGTPGGVGWFREPKQMLRDGDEVVVEIEGIGRLVNRCREERAQ